MCNYIISKEYFQTSLSSRRHLKKKEENRFLSLLMAKKHTEDSGSFYLVLIFTQCPYQWTENAVISFWINIVIYWESLRAHCCKEWVEILLLTWNAAPMFDSTCLSWYETLLCTAGLSFDFWTLLLGTFWLVSSDHSQLEDGCVF